MKTLRIALVALALSSICWGWNCTVPGQVRVQVPTGTLGSGTGDGSGQVVVDGGLTFICEALPTGGGPTNTSTTTNNNSNVNTNSNSNANTNNVNNTLSNSNTLSNNQKQQQQQTQQQTQTATGGSASSTSSATGGNSTSNAAGGNATSNGDNSNNTTVLASKIPVSSAITAPALPSAPCVKSYGGSVQTMPFGAGFSGGKIDEGCDIRETARSYAGISKLAQCKLLVSEKQSKKAGVTLEDCLGVAPVPVIAPQPVIVHQDLVLVSPAVTIAVPEYVEPVKVSSVSCGKLDNICKRNLDNIVLRLKAEGGRLSVVATLHTDTKFTSDLIEYLKRSGADSYFSVTNANQATELNITLIN